MSLNYGILKTLKMLAQAFQYDIFKAIIVSVLIFVILIIKSNNKIYKYIITLINIIILILINYYYYSGFKSFKFSNPINNIYFYFFNTCIFLILYTVQIYFKKNIKIYIIIYGIILINISFSLFMTHYLNNTLILVIGNIYPMIKIGNIAIILYYIFLTKDIIHAIIKPNFKGVNYFENFKRRFKNKCS